MAPRNVTCPSCSKPFTIDGVGATIPAHTIGVVRNGKVKQVPCPGSNTNPN